jgi:hypothetical protein
MPPFYPNVITVEPNSLNSSAINTLMDESNFSWAIKDSYNDYDPVTCPYKLLFSACWYGYIVGNKRLDNTNYLALSYAETDDELQKWIEAWGQTPKDSQIFNNVLLNDQRVQFIYLRDQQTISCGAILHSSNEVLGITNLFGNCEDQQRLIKTIQLSFPDSDLVGYGDEDELIRLKPFGFHELGKLNILYKK